MSDQNFSFHVLKNPGTVTATVSGLGSAPTLDASPNLVVVSCVQTVRFVARNLGWIDARGQRAVLVAHRQP